MADDLQVVMRELALQAQRMEQGFAVLRDMDERHARELSDLKASVDRELESTKSDISTLREKIHKLETEHAVTKANAKTTSAAIAAVASAIIGSIVSYVGHIAQH